MNGSNGRYTRHTCISQEVNEEWSQVGSDIEGRVLPMGQDSAWRPCLEMVNGCNRSS